jgi:iron complex outermembrane receptor protein
LVLPLKFQKETLTADAYIRIDDRVTLTDQFSRPSGTFAAGTPQRELQLQFDMEQMRLPFANAISTESKGIDIIVTHS